MMTRAQLDIVLCRKSFPDFVRLAWPHYTRRNNYTPSKGFEVVARALQEAYESHGTTLLNLPPGFGKSSLLSLWQVWVWTLDPAHAFFFGSYSGSELGKREAGKIVGLVSTDWFRQRWPQVSFVDRKHKAEADPGVKVLFTSAGGVRFSGTPLTGVTGEHFDTQIYDDMHKAHDPRIEEVDRMLTETMPTRWRGPRRTVSASQRICVGDVTDVLSRINPEARKIILPLRYDPEKASPYDWRQTRGELLDPVRVTELDARTMESALTPSARAAQLQQDPTSGQGKVWKEDGWLKRIKRADLPRMSVVIDSWDLTFKGLSQSKSGKVDKVAGQKWGRSGPNVYLIGRVPPIERGLIDSIRMVNSFRTSDPEYPTHTILIEDKANGPGVMDALRHDVPGIVAINPQGSKYERGELAAMRGESGNVYIVEEEYEFTLHQCKAFPRMAFDDDMDVMHQAINYLLSTHRGFASEVSDDPNDMEDVNRMAQRLLGVRIGDYEVD